MRGATRRLLRSVRADRSGGVARRPVSGAARGWALFALGVFAGLLIWLGLRSGPTDDSAAKSAPATARDISSPRRRNAPTDEIAQPAPLATPVDGHEVDVAARLREPVEPFELDVKQPLAVAGRAARECRVPIVASAELVRAWSKGAEIPSVTFDGGSGADALALLSAVVGARVVRQHDRIVLVPLEGEWDRNGPFTTPPDPGPFPTLRVTGNVYDERDEVVRGGEVVRVPAEFRFVRTDDAGRYEIAVRRPFGALQARAGQFSYSKATAVSGEVGDVVRIDLRLRSDGGSVVLEVTDGNAAIPSTELTVEVRDGDAHVLRALARESTNDVGEFLVPNLPVGAATVIVRSAAGAEGRAAVAVASGETARVRVVLVKRATLSDRVARAQVSMSFRDTPSSDVVRFLCDSSGINVLLSPEVEDLSSARVSVAASGKSLKEVLDDLCLRIGGVRYELREADDLVVIIRDKH